MSKGIVFVIVLAAFLLSLNLGYRAVPTPKTISFYSPAIGEEGKGTLVKFTLHSFPGGGRILVNVRGASYKPDVEEAFRNSVHYAEQYLGVSLKRQDFVLEVGEEDFQQVSGGSAGAMFSAAVIALQSDRRLREDRVMSASLDENGSLGAVGGIEEKILAAQADGKGIFLVSQDQEIRYSQELQAQIQIQRAKTLQEALSYLVA